MFQMFIGSILTDNIGAIQFVVVGLLAIAALTLIVKKIFKLALIVVFIAIAAYYAVPGLITVPPLP